MKRHQKSMVRVVSGFALYLASVTAQAGDSFFSFNIGYSSHGHYFNPHRYVYAPTHFYVVPSPFFFGYTSYYYPVFPYYYTPVVYYRPVLPYYYPYAFKPHWYSYHRHYAYRPVYPRSFLYGYYPYNRYYSHYPYKHYKYHGDYHRDHFHRHTDRKQYAGPYKKDAYDQKLKDDHHKPAWNKNENDKYADTARDKQRVQELEKYRSALRKNDNNNGKPGFSGNRPQRNNERSLALNNRSEFTRKTDVPGVNTKDKNRSQSEQPREQNRNINNDVIERLINRDRPTSRTAVAEKDNRPVQNRETGIRHEYRQSRSKQDDVRSGFLSDRGNQFQRQNSESRLSEPEHNRDKSLRGQSGSIARNDRSYQRQSVPQHTTRNENYGARNSLRQPPAVAYKRQDNQPSQSKNTFKRRDSTENMSNRGGQMSIRQGGGMQNRGISSRQGNSRFGFRP